MTHQEILTKAVQKAIDNGWDKPNQLDFTSNAEFVYYLDDLSLSPITLKWLNFKTHELIYNHDFAKALWGDEFRYFVARDGRGTSVGEIEYATYKYHLQQMVISDDPIKYLGENI
jgi:hypothetical protein